ncbi:MAG: glutamate racemase [Gammaproteobacteria bacterium]
MPLPAGFIGIIDSGVGGLAVLRAVRELLPAEALVYVADSGHAPYGDKPADYIAGRVDVIVARLEALGAKAVVIACNTATVTAVEALRARHALPIVGIEPAIKPAVAASPRGRILVLATQRTAESAAVATLCARHGGDADILVQPCPGLADLVEAGLVDPTACDALLRRYLSPTRAERLDAVVLGCTHFTFLEPWLRDLLGPAVAIIEPSGAVARQLARRLPWAAPADAGGEEYFFTTGAAPREAAAVMSRLLARRVDVEAAEALGIATNL